MDIKKRHIFIFFFFLLVFVSSISLMSISSCNGIPSKEKSHGVSETVVESYAQPKEATLPDKVYTFLAPTDTFTSDYELDDHYIYYIYIELVSPHYVTIMRIRIWDPDNNQYNIFESNMTFSPESGRYFEIPFGTALSGEYSFEFYSISTVNFNLHIQISKGPKCLHDKIDPQQIEGIMLYDVKAFTNGESITETDIDFNSDTMYNFYISRVSAISIVQSNEIRIDCSIEDPDGVVFDIYNNRLMEDIDGMNKFLFGTAVKGEYIFRVTIYCSVAFVNIAYAIIEDYQIAEGLIGDEKEEKKITLEDIAEDIKKSTTQLPTEWMVGTLVFIGAIAGFALILLINQKKMGNVALNIREK